MELLPSLSISSHTHYHVSLSIATPTVLPVALSWPAAFPFPPLSWCFVTARSRVNTVNKSKVGPYLAATYPEYRMQFQAFFPANSLSCPAPHHSLPRSYRSVWIYLRVSGIYQTLLSLHCLHNTPVISMGTSPGMAGEEVAPVCDTPFLNKWFTLSLAYHRVQEVNMKLSTPDRCKGCRVFRKVSIWSSTPVQSPWGCSWQTETGRGGGTPGGPEVALLSLSG